MEETELHVWLTDKDGYYLGELDAAGATQTFEEYAANALKNGQVAIQKAGTKRPADRPLTKAQQALVAKNDRLTVLRWKGWAALTPEEQVEARTLAFDLGQWAPS